VRIRPSPGTVGRIVDEACQAGSARAGEPYTLGHGQIVTHAVMPNRCHSTIQGCRRGSAVRLRSSQDQDAPTLRLLTGDELRSSAPLARCRRNRSRSRQQHPAAAYVCRPSCFECQEMRARAASHAAISLPYVRVRRRVRFWAGAWPRVIGCPGLETVSLFVPKRDRVAALMSWRQGGWVIGRTD
jgi:hypothetical protein